MSISWPPIASISSRIDLHDLLVDLPARRQEAPQAGADLADQPGADEQLVRDRLGVRGVVAQRREEQLGLAPDHEAAQGSRVRNGGAVRCPPATVRERQSSGISDASAIASAAGFAILRRFGRCMPPSIQRSISTKSSSISVSDGTFFSTRPCA